MGAFQNIKIKDYFKRYGYKYGLERGIFTAMPFHCIKDYENKKLLYYHKTKRRLKRKYMKKASVDPNGISYGKLKSENPIWLYWKQGIDNAPEIVKKAVASVKKYAETEVILLEDTNIFDYVKFPDYIMERLKSGHMSTAAFSDLLRFSLLEHYGGTWIDATVLLTGKIPEYILKSDFFAFQDTFGPMDNPAKSSSWFLHCKPHNIIMRETRNMIFAYWASENYVIEYLFSYIFLTMSLENHSEIKEKMPYANSDYCYLMLQQLDKEYNAEKEAHICELSTIHKLTYKLQEHVYTDSGNLYHKILEMVEMKC